ncbi:hypothetical protein Agabi119p4_1862 [Agaricus bisporus var. burnettii]|uniref:Uncharacterized protein n=1 Tax=Agaricus bisporus var. burnettii TaxID=192524 RepID=A0A8H7F7Z2_AGABI|nr:hypothetical protein Agabi119p4_1862 [Agaricus bisporus var. burnettii]
MPRIAQALLRILANPPRLALGALVTHSAHRPPIPRFTVPPLLAVPHFPQPSPILGALTHVRFAQRGMEYQPSQRKRKRKHGFLARPKVSLALA